MDYKIILRSKLLSKINIDFLVNIIVSNFKISQKATPKCINIIVENFNKYLNNLERYPENDNELIAAIQYLNNKCYDDFVTYLHNKYPNMSLLRNEYQSTTISAHENIQMPQQNQFQ